eukprot:2678790-Amphidinium_carterae.1
MRNTSSELELIEEDMVEVKVDVEIHIVLGDVDELLVDGENVVRVDVDAEVDGVVHVDGVDNVELVHVT